MEVSGHFTPWPLYPVITHWKRGRMDLRAGLDSLEKKEKVPLFFLPVIERRSSSL
jgi:hypothetical protein